MIKSLESRFTSLPLYLSSGQDDEVASIDVKMLRNFTGNFNMFSARLFLKHKQRTNI